MPRFFRTLVVFFMFTAVQSASAQWPTDGFDNWQGRWKAKIKDQVIYETWEKTGDKNFVGLSWVVDAKGDSVFSETIRLYLLNDNIYYEPQVKGQHGNRPMPFRLLISSGNSWLFSNPENDFPQFVYYKLIDENHLRASIGNSENGEEHPVVYNYERY